MLRLSCEWAPFPNKWGTQGLIWSSSEDSSRKLITDRLLGHQSRNIYVQNRIFLRGRVRSGDSDLFIRMYKILASTIKMSAVWLERQSACTHMFLYFSLCLLSDPLLSPSLLCSPLLKCASAILGLWIFVLSSSTPVAREQTGPENKPWNQADIWFQLWVSPDGRP